MTLSLFITIFVFSTLLILFLFLQSPTFPTTFTLLDDAHFTKSPAAISLTRELPGSVGRAFLTYPIRFLAPNSSASFSCTFSFTIATTPFSAPGDGLAFLVTSNATSYSVQTGLPGVRQSFLAVEFNTSFNPHIALDINGALSSVLVPEEAAGIDLTSGKRITSWVEYHDEEMTIWVSYSPFRPPDPVISTRIDLSGQNLLKEFMHVGFSASNGPMGSARHVVESWEFKTFGLSTEDAGEKQVGRSCLMCVLDNDYLDFNLSRRDIVGLLLGILIKVLSVLGLIALFLVLGVVVYCLWYFFSRRLRGGVSLVRLNKITDGFGPNRALGQGVAAIVYKGFPFFRAWPFNERWVAVKRFRNMAHFVGFGHDFTRRVRRISSLKHRNLVRLLAWNFEDDEHLILVYEYVDHQSLRFYLAEYPFPVVPNFDFRSRVNILTGIASALAYLHKHREGHGDVKTCNIMVDGKNTVKLGDFGFLDIYENIQTAPPMRRAYSPPEFQTHGLTAKTDVYSFGVVVFEVATGRPPVAADDVTLAFNMQVANAEHRLLDEVDIRLQYKYPEDEMVRVLKIGLACVRMNPGERPTMKQVKKMLRGETEVPEFPSEAPVVPATGEEAVRAAEEEAARSVQPAIVHVAGEEAARAAEEEIVRAAEEEAARLAEQELVRAAAEKAARAAKQEIVRAAAEEAARAVDEEIVRAAGEEAARAAEEEIVRVMGQESARRMAVAVHSVKEGMRAGAEEASRAAQQEAFRAGQQEIIRIVEQEIARAMAEEAGRDVE